MMVNGLFWAETLNAVESGHWFATLSCPLSPDASTKMKGQRIAMFRKLPENVAILKKKKNKQLWRLFRC